MQPVNPAKQRAVAPRGGQIPPFATSVLDVDLDCLEHNYRYLNTQVGPHAQAAAVLKANAYGLGSDKVSQALKHAGCKEFYVATVEEGIKLRKALGGEPKIFMLNGLLPGMEPYLKEHAIIPVLNDIDQIQLWKQYAQALEQKLPASLHFDTGMCRVGLPLKDAQSLKEDPTSLEGLDLQFVLSHLACSDQPEHPKNQEQLERFKTIRSFFPETPASFANSHGILLGQDYYFDQVRPGRSLYGVGSKSLTAQSLRQAVQVYIKILQVRNVEPGESVGYNATYQVKKPSRLAVIAVGYADGLLRTGTHQSIIHIQGYPTYIAGRMSMDLLTLDVSEVPEHLVYPGAWTEYIGDHKSMDDVANALGTISHEILVNFGPRYYRNYIRNDS